MSVGSGFVAAREEVAAAARALAGSGLVSASAGNVSLRVDGGRAITKGGVELGAAGADDVVVVSAEGETIGGSGRPSSELPLHLMVGADAIVHTHSHFATVLSCFGDDVPAIHYLMARLGGPVRVAPYATFGTPELAAAVEAGLRGRRAVLLANHGAVATGDSLAEAVATAELLEWVCSIAYHARVIGGPSQLTEQQLEQVAKSAAEIRYGDRG